MYMYFIVFDFFIDRICVQIEIDKQIDISIDK